MIKFYGYDKCSTCRKAKKHLDAAGVEYESIDITQHPPSKTLLTALIKSGEYDLKDLFNKSGQLYREMDLKTKLATMSEADAIELLSKNGKLVKRPIVTGGKKQTVGYDEAKFRKVWG